MTQTHATAFHQLLTTWNHRQDLRTNDAPFEARIVADRQLAQARQRVTQARLAA